jgi:GNAT superfamily N-acetyltransferase
MARLASSFGETNVNILDLQIFPSSDGAVDELVLSTPDEWTATNVAELVTAAGAADAHVSECAPHSLRDQAVSYARAAQVISQRPDALEEQLCSVLDARAGQGPRGHEHLVLDDEAGPVVILHRRVAFTDTERARATALHQVAAAAGATTRTPARSPEESLPVQVRRGCLDDSDELVAMHARCSAETVFRRYHTAMPHLPARMAHALLQPEHGWSLVMTSRDGLIGVAMLAVDGTGGADVGIMVEDRWQRRGLGARLMCELAIQAADQRLSTLTCVTQAENTALLATLKNAGLTARITHVDGVIHATTSIAKLSHAPGVHQHKRSIGSVTVPLVSLLHRRSELREIHAGAALIDQTIRDGA